MSESGSVLVLGGSGFIGRRVVSEAVNAGFGVVALARSDAAAIVVESLGAEVLRGNVEAPRDWIARCVGVNAIVDVTQPTVPKRLTARAIGLMAEQRVAATRAMLRALETLEPASRPWWISVSGTDDLLPDQAGLLSSRSGLRPSPRGFAHIGLPVRAVIESSAIDAAFVYLGQMVYGAGKSYANFVVDGIRTGKARMVGSAGNTLPLTHVDDAGAAVIHVLSQGRLHMAGRTIVAVPATPATQHDLFAVTATAMDRPMPGRVPAALAALVAGKINAQVMTLDARCDPDLLTSTGFRFQHEELASGVASSLAAMAHPGSTGDHSLPHGPADV